MIYTEANIVKKTTILLLIFSVGTAVVVGVCRAALTQSDLEFATVPMAILWMKTEFTVTTLMNALLASTIAGRNNVLIPLGATRVTVQMDLRLRFAS